MAAEPGKPNDQSFNVAPENKNNRFYQDKPPMFCLKIGDMHVMPKMTRQPDGRWVIQDPEHLRKMLDRQQSNDRQSGGGPNPGSTEGRSTT